jgi:diguanylate cyclase (GGDEF)-like protein
MHDALEKALADALMRRQSPQVSSGGTQPSQQRATVRVLVVDDNDGDADLVADYLMGIASVHFAVERATRLGAAIEAIASSPPDIVLLDLGLPDSQGTGTFQRLRQAADAIPLVVLTGNNDGDVASAVLKAGAQDFLVKGSFDDEALVRTLRHALERHRAQLEQRELVRRLAEANQQLMELANTDALTGVLNRRGLEAALADLWLSAQRQPVRIVGLLIDCDDFKAINEQEGHATGDIVLAGVARSIASTLRSVDYVGRVGGDEFLVLLVDIGVWDALYVAERIRRAVRFPRDLEHGQGVTVSIGVAELRVTTKLLSEALAATGASLRTSKRSGKNKVVFADDENATVAIDRVELGHRLASPGEVRVVSQPIVDLANGGVVARELLARFKSPGLGEPNDFFRIAHEADMLTAADVACLRACMRIAHQLDAPRLHLNVFPSTLLEVPTEHLQELFGALLPRICLEISEKQSVANPTVLKQRLAPLRERGLTIAIDDIGVGQTSLELLLVLEPETVKIDGEFVSAAATRELPSAARSIVKLMRCVEHLGATSIAEGIESEAQLEAMKGFGVRLGQGYLWGKPEG